ncbi:MAG: 2-oxoacid:acceptor oxidoreductase family protein [Planctomycetota bacterium]
MNRDLEIVVCGVGGQGILFLARTLYEMARRAGRKVMGSETHGMSQRGGSVTSHVKIGDFHSPMVRAGAADLLIVVKAEEVYANLSFLKEGGCIVMNASSGFALDPGVERALKEKGIGIFCTDATKCAMAADAPMAANLVLLSSGIQAGYIPSDYDSIVETVAAVTPQKFLENNLAAVKAGFTR